mgnify:CR=1 FL=1
MTIMTAEWEVIKIRRYKLRQAGRSKGSSPSGGAGQSGKKSSLGIS